MVFPDRGRILVDLVQVDGLVLIDKVVWWGRCVVFVAYVELSDVCNTIGCLAVKLKHNLSNKIRQSETHFKQVSSPIVFLEYLTNEICANIQIV